MSTQKRVRKSQALSCPRSHCPSLPNEVWRAVLGHEGLYSVSNLGRVRSEPRVVIRKNGLQQTVHARILRTPPNKSGTGYFECGICNKGAKNIRLVHQLVLEAFVGPRPVGTVCCHNDGNSRNNRLENLRWDTTQSNADDSRKHGTLPRGESSNFAVLKEPDVIAIRSDDRLQRQIAEHYGVSASLISRIKSRDVWAHI